MYILYNYIYYIYIKYVYFIYVYEIQGKLKQMKTVSDFFCV